MHKQFNCKRIHRILTLIFCLAIIFIPLKSSTILTIEDYTDSEEIYLPILMYHEVKTFNTGKDVITPYEFESDLKYLSAKHYNTITMSHLIDYVYNDAQLPENPIIISFDDGYLNNYKYVYPLLEKYQMKIVLSIIGKNTDDFTNIPDNNLDYSHVTWDQLNEMLNSGLVEVQNHSYNLHSNTNKRYGCMQNPGESILHYEQILTNDIVKFQELLTLKTGKIPNTFTYPYGKYNKNTDIILRKLGFKATLSCKYGINVITKNSEGLFGLKRICRSHGQSAEKVLTEAYKTLK